LPYNKAVDGRDDKLTQEALKNAEAKGYKWNAAAGKLEKVFSGKSAEDSPSQTEASTHNILEKALDLVKLAYPLYRRPFIGSEEDARKLGYENYAESYFEPKKKVSYPVDEKLTGVKKAAAQMKKYGITSEYAEDKSPVSQFFYNYLPNYGYDIPALISNVVYNTPTYDKGQVVGTPEHKNLKKIYTIANKIGTILGYSMDAQDNVDRAASASRQDLRNLRFGYPMQNGTYEVNTEHTHPRHGEFEYGYAIRPTDKAGGNSSESIFRSNAWNNDYIKSIYKATGLKQRIDNGYNLGHFTLSENPTTGERSYYDDWDLGLFGGNTYGIFGNKKIEIYDKQK